MKKQRILIVGGGGREAMIVEALAREGGIEIFCAPGNAGIAEKARCYPVEQNDHDGLLGLARNVSPEITIIGPEKPLVNGIVDLFRASGFSCVGPLQKAAMLEGSKVFAKRFMKRHDIPTSPFAVFTDPGAALAHVKANPLARVIKADGLCGGKGVVVAGTEVDAAEAITDMLVKHRLGDAGKTIVIEERLEGWECSFTVLTDGKNCIPLVPAVDYKRRFDGDTGPNTGGMGSYSTSTLLSGDLYARIMHEIIFPTIEGMRKEKNPFQGVLYAGLMISQENPYVLEFNVRFGDPELQSILSRLRSSFIELTAGVAHSTLSAVEPVWSSSPALCVIIVDANYPATVRPGKIITGIDRARQDGALVLHAGTSRNARGKLVTAGGRVLNVIATGSTITDARSTVYSAASEIRFAGMDYRRDIAKNPVHL